MDNLEHEKSLEKMVIDHCDVMQIQDKIQIMDALKDVLIDIESTVKTLSRITKDARLSGYKLGRATAQK